MQTTGKLHFNEDWNGKVTGTKRAFTSIRLASGAWQQGGLYEVTLKDMAYDIGHRTVGVAKLVDFRLFKLADLPSITAWLDTGYDKVTTANIIKAMYKNKQGLNIWTADWVLLLFVWHPPTPAPPRAYHLNLNDYDL